MKTNTTIKAGRYALPGTIGLGTIPMKIKTSVKAGKSLYE